MNLLASLDKNPRRCRLIAGSLLIGVALLRLTYLAFWSQLDLAPDEAHYWDWSRHLDWAYYSKGPLVALLIRASLSVFGPLSLAITGSEVVAVRLPALVCGTLMLAGLYELTRLVWGRSSWSLLVVLAGLTLPVVAAGSSLMTIDAPFLCFWTWALVTGFLAISKRCQEPFFAWQWPATGALVALGLLTKPTMVLFIPCFGLFLLATPALRSLLLRPGFWIMTFVAGLGALPILLWNVQHDWVTLRHTGSHAGVHTGRFVHWHGPFVYLGTQFGLFLGFWFVAWAAGVFRFHPGRETRSRVRYAWWMSAPVFAFFGLFSLKNGGGEPNWPIAGYLAGMPLAVGWIAEQLQSSRPWARRLTLTTLLGTAALGLFATVVAYAPRHFQPLFAVLSGPPTPQRPMPMRRLDPTCRLRGWRTLAQAVDAVRVEHERKGTQLILAATAWTLPGELGFYCDGHPHVFCIGPALGTRHSQYDLWRPNPIADPDTFRGQSFLVVDGNDGVLSAVFDRVEPTRVIEHREGDHLIVQWTLTIGHGFRGFPHNSADGW